MLVLLVVSKTGAVNCKLLHVAVAVAVAVDFAVDVVAAVVTDPAVAVVVACCCCCCSCCSCWLLALTDSRSESWTRHASKN